VSLYTTDVLVKEVVDVPAGVNLTPFIDTAEQLVTEVCMPVVPAYDAARLTKIATWLAAHCYAVNYRRSKSEGVTGGAGVNVTYDGVTALGLKNTLHGQTAMLLDTAGGLAALDKQVSSSANVLHRKTGVFWLGTDPDV
jgi:hypothetical protein